MMDKNGFAALAPWEGFGDEVVTGILMQDMHGRLLLQFRDAWPGVVDGGRWGLFGGAREKGETLEAACVREVREELGIAMAESTLRPFAKAISNPPEHKQIYVFTSSHPFKVSEIKLGEGAGFAVFNKEQLGQIDIAKPLIPLINLYRETFMMNGGK